MFLNRTNGLRTFDALFPLRIGAARGKIATIEIKPASTGDSDIGVLGDSSLNFFMLHSSNVAKTCRRKTKCNEASYWNVRERNCWAHLDSNPNRKKNPVAIKGELFPELFLRGSIHLVRAAHP
jgi:hypothetical protein